MIKTIINAIEEYEKQSNDSSLETDRAQALEYYFGDLPKGNGIPDRSQAVSRDVADSVNWIMPGIIRVFTAGDDVVSFSPRNQNDIEGAQQETDYINYVITQKNNWFDTCYQWVFDGLVQKNGYVKAWWDESVNLEKETYKGKTEDELAFILQDPEVEIVAHESYPSPYQQQNPMAMLMQEASQVPMLHNFTVQKKKTYACAKYIPLPPERTKVYAQHGSVDLEHCEFFEHWEDKSISDLRKEGFDVPDDIADQDGISDDIGEQARERYNENSNKNDDSVDKASRRVRVRECWLRFDEDEDGIAELRHVIVIGKKSIVNEEAEIIPVAAWTPRIIPHKHIGQSEADAARDIQDIKSTLQRGFIDNVYFAVNARHGVDEDRVNLDDMLTSRPAGVVRTKGPPSQSIMPLVTTANFEPVLAGIQYFDSVREDRTGSSKASQQISPDVLAKMPSGIAIAQLMSASQALIELKARVFAETGVKRLFKIIHALTLKNAKEPEVVRLRNKWVPVDPRQWTTRTDMQISVGLGTGNKEAQLVGLQQILAAELQMLPIGLSSAKTIHHTLSKLTQAQGFKDVEAFWVNPEQAQQIKPPAPPPPDPIQIGKLKIEEFNAQTNRAKVSGELKLSEQELMLKAREGMKPEALPKMENPEKERADILDTYAGIDLKAAQRDKILSEVNATQQATNQVVGQTQGMELMTQALTDAIKELSRPRRKVPVRGKDGRISHVDELPMN